MGVFSCSGEGVAEVLAEIRRRLPDNRVPAVLYFADERYDAAELAKGITALFPKTTVCIGCSAYAGLTAEGIARGGVTVTSLGSDLVEAAAGGLVENLAAGANPRPLLVRMGAALGADLAYASPDRYAGLVLAEGFDYGQDRLLNELGDQTLIHFVGGTASDALAYGNCWVACGREVRRDAAALCVLKMKRHFLAAKTQSLRLASGRTYAPGRFTSNPLVINTLGGRRAGDVLREAGGVAQAVSDEEIARAIHHNILGLSAGGEIFAFFAHSILPDGSLQMHGAPRHDLPLGFLEWTDTVADLRKAMERVKLVLGGPPVLLLDFMCLLRLLRLKRESRLDDYVRVYDGIPVAGFATYGEAYYAHVNATSTFFAVGPE